MHYNTLQDEQVEMEKDMITGPLFADWAVIRQVEYKYSMVSPAERTD
jgi:hypothetical protein